MKLTTRLRSTMMRVMASERFLDFRRRQARRQRVGRPEVVYCHQVDDPFSDLALQALAKIQGHYQVEFKIVLVRPPEARYQGSASQFNAWAIRDAAAVAEGFGLSGGFTPSRITPERVQRAQSMMASLLQNADVNGADFFSKVVAVSRAFWTGELQDDEPRIDPQPLLDQGNRIRQRLGHYLGGMLYFEGEWYWGVDRLGLLETRLIEAGFQVPGRPAIPLFSEPSLDWPHTLRADTVILEYFPSLRSPYTAVIHRSVCKFVEASGVQLKVRPVMPMMMRGVPAPFLKGRYIMMDAAREGRRRGVAFRGIVDPFGEPVLKAFALFPGAQALGLDLAFVTAYLKASWVDGVDITRRQGLETVAAELGLTLSQLQAAAQDKDWQSVLQDNLTAMSDAGLWGVPSFRVSGGGRSEPFACWGQDRLWRVVQEVARRIEPVAEPS